MTSTVTSSLSVSFPRHETSLRWRAGDVQPLLPAGLDLTLEVKPNLYLSDSNTLLLRLHWVAVLFGHLRADMAVTGGVHTVYGLLKSMMAGARAVMSTSCLLRYGIEYGGQIIQDLKEWMEEHEYESIGQMCGSMSQRNVPNPAAFERSNYIRVLSSYSLRGNS